MNVRTLLVWGLLAGLLGGILAFGFAYAFGEPPVEVAITLEGEGHDHGAEAPPEVTRDVQSTLGLAIATCAFGTALGGLFALAFAFAYGRIGPLTPRWCRSSSTHPTRPRWAGARPSRSGRRPSSP
jgi:Probable cobalt transporter subunit (CbtA)